MADEFGGIAVDEPSTDEFGGVAIEEPAQTLAPPQPSGALGTRFRPSVKGFAGPPSQSILGISPESIPSGAGTKAPWLTIPLSVAGKTAAGAAGYFTSPQGMTETAATLTPLAPVIFAKWAYDMVRGGYQSTKAIVDELGQMANEAFNKGVISANQLGPIPEGKTTQEHIQSLAENAANAALMSVGGVASGLHAAKGLGRIVPRRELTSVPETPPGTSRAIEEPTTTPPEIPEEALRRLKTKVRKTLQKPYESGLRDSSRPQAENPYVEGSVEAAAWESGRGTGIGKIQDRTAVEQVSESEKSPPAVAPEGAPPTAPATVTAKEVSPVVAGSPEPAITEPKPAEPVGQAVSVTTPVTEEVKPAAAKVEREVQKVATTEGQRSAKEVKSELVSRLEDELKSAKSKDTPTDQAANSAFEKWNELRQSLEQETNTKTLASIKKKGSELEKEWMKEFGISDVGIWNDAFGSQLQGKAFAHGKVTIEIPGDGTFTVYKTKEALQSILDRAKAIKTSPNLPPKIKRTGISAEDKAFVEQQLSKPGTATTQEPIGMGGAVGSEFEPSGGTATSIKNAVVDQERIKRGLPPAIQPLKRSFGEVWDRAMAMIDHDPAVTDNLLDSLRAKPRALDDFEDALLLQRQVDLQNDYAKATRDLAQAFEDGRTDATDSEKIRVARLSDQLLDLYNIGKRVGTETGRGLNARKMLANEVFF